MRLAVSLMVGALSLACGTARADDDASALDGKRDQLLDRIARGVDLAASVRAFAALYAEHEKLVPPSERIRSDAAAKRAWRDAYDQTVDGVAGPWCRLAVDPLHPPLADHDRFLADWGRVTRKEEVRRPPKNALDDGELVPMVEVLGVRGRYRFRADRFAFPKQTFAAAVGDLVLVCAHLDPSQGASDADPWSGTLDSGRAIRIAAPPRSTKKAKWDPIHVTENHFFWAIRDVVWKLPVDRFVLTHVDVLTDEGGGRYQIDATQKLTWMLEVPPSVKGRELLVPGQGAWVIAGHPRFDRGLKKLVLTAEDIEARYLIGPGEKLP